MGGSWLSLKKSCRLLSARQRNWTEGAKKTKHFRRQGANSNEELRNSRTVEHRNGFCPLEVKPKESHEVMLEQVRYVSVALTVISIIFPFFPRRSHTRSHFLIFRCQCTMGGMTMKSMRGVPDRSLVCSLVHTHRSLICLLCIARFASALRCAHSLACSLAHSL